jgi:hypothetical protein
MSQSEDENRRCYRVEQHFHCRDYLPPGPSLDMPRVWLRYILEVLRHQKRVSLALPDGLGGGDRCR